ncbi:MAG TPA: Wzt carbohydrate-binding domain-containing protein [Bryobacteraceae bacterium]|nr:Wzt carbohydrate-binding domain-containing protein [Bryobacteraceae bacterium]
MAIEFRGVRFSPLHGVTAAAPSGAVIGIIGEKGAGKSAMLRLAAGFDRPAEGEVLFEGTRRYLGPADPLDLTSVKLLLIEHTFARQDALARAQGFVQIDRLRSEGATVLIVSNELDLVRSLSDEVWWLESGALVGRGDPREVLAAYRHRIAEKFRAWGEGLATPLRLSQRRGDGRAELIAIETLGASGQPAMVWQSGETVTVRVTARYGDPVGDPVIGIMIRTRIGLEVYGTNTELEKLTLGPCAAGSERRIDFRFSCGLCPGEYTLTVASHDPDGTAHDWIDDAVAFVVTDSRYTAGVANLRAQVAVEKI